VEPTVSLRELTAANLEAVRALRIAPEQEAFVTTVEESMIEAAEDIDGLAQMWAVFADEQPVGFVMVSDEVTAPGYISQYLWKLLIDERHQRRGYGTATLDLVADFFRARPHVKVMWTSAGRGEGSPIPFYERYGFVRTGETVFGDEALLRLDI
jgi:diamine N-acetyltransferase